MTVKIGVIGAGAMGRAHIDRIEHQLGGGAVVGITDVDQTAAQKAQAELAPAATVYPDTTSLLQAPDIDAVFVVSAGFAHAETILAALATDKAIFTEKPLATDADDAQAIVDQEQRLGQRRIQVGFMRRYDPALVALRAQLRAGTIGAPLAVQAAHINLEQAASYSNPMAITDTLIHEIDEMRWLLGEDYASVQVVYSKQSRQPVNPTLHDPQLATLITQSGVVIQVLVHLTATYGYEVRTQVIGETGELWLPVDGVAPLIRTQGQVQQPIETNWVHRFLTAYNLEVQAFIDDVAAHRPPQGPSAWDGYVAARVAAAAIASQETGQVQPLTLPAVPAFYQSEAQSART